MREEFETQPDKEEKLLVAPWSNHYSYSDCFNIVFVALGLTGVGCIILTSL